MTDLPTGTITFLFTDIEGSTKRWEQSPLQMRGALARHDALLRDAIADNDGYVFKTVGDAFCAAFRTAAAALTAARDAQRALASEPWGEGIPAIKVRMALHTGTAEIRDHDYFGQPLNRVARFLAAGHGGQILLSLATQQLVRDSLPRDVTLHELGERRLKDLHRPEQVFQAVVNGLRSEFPPLRTLDAYAHNLPVQLTSFIGREKELGEIKSLLGRTRLLTFTGSGGCGKTRLAIHLAADLLESFPDGAWVAELAALADPALVPQAVAAVFRIREQPGKDITESLIEYLQSKHMLLVLDNCEHLLNACVDLVDAILRRCPKVVLLISSRQGLAIAGELTYRVPSLSTPDPGRDLTLERVMHYESAQLFVQRAQFRQPQFAATSQNAKALASICHRLDGIPLAVELAAARVRSMSVEEVNQRLDHVFRLLTGGSRTALPRQQTLRSLIDWSYNLLSDAEKRLLVRLAVFAGGFVLETVEEVCLEETDTWMALDLVTSLVDKSLVVVEEHGGATRYRLLETVRQYARDRLLESDEAQLWQERHLAHYLKLAEASEPHLSSADQLEWLERLTLEHDNFRAALTFALGNSRHNTTGLQLAGALGYFWAVRGYLAEGRSWLAALLRAAPTAPAVMRAKALTAAGYLARRQGDFVGAKALYENCLGLSREIDDRSGIARSHGCLGTIAMCQADYGDARALQEQSLALYRDLGDHKGISFALSQLGNIAREQGRYDEARPLLDESLAMERAAGNRRGVAVLLSHLANIATEQGDYRTDRTLNEESLAIFRELGDRDSVALLLNNLSEGACDQGEFDRARALLDESTQIYRETGDRHGLALALNSLGVVSRRQGDYNGALTLLKEALSLRRDVGDRLGIAWSLEGLAYIAVAKSQVAQAARIWGAAERLRNEIGAPLPPKDRLEYDREVARARAASESAPFEHAWQEGHRMPLDQAVRYAMELSPPKARA